MLGVTGATTSIVLIYNFQHLNIPELVSTLLCLCISSSLEYLAICLLVHIFAPFCIFGRYKRIKGLKHYVDNIWRKMLFPSMFELELSLGTPHIKFKKFK